MVGERVGKGGVVVVKRCEESVVVGGNGLVGICEDLRGKEGVRVGKGLVMVRDLRVDVMKGKVEVIGLVGCGFGCVGVGMGYGVGEGEVGSEVWDSWVDCERWDDRENWVCVVGWI